MTTKTDAARECAGQWVHCSPYLIYAGVDCAKTPRRPCECDFGGSHDHFISWETHFPPSVPEGWMRDKEKVLKLATHLEGIGWQMDSNGDIDCVHQDAAMAAEVIRRVLLPLIAEAK